MKWVYLIVLLAFYSIASAISLQYRITSLGIKVADLRLELSDSRAVFKAWSKPDMLIFPHINNTYDISYKANCLPVKYTRLIHQGTIKDSVVVLYNDTTANVWQKSKVKPYSYPKSPLSRDVFSLIMLLTKHGNTLQSYSIDANGTPWKAYVSTLKGENVKTDLGIIKAHKYVVTFKPQSRDKIPYIDMLTHNFVTEDTRLTLWVSMDGIPLKAAIKKNMMSMNWELVKKS